MLGNHLLGLYEKALPPELTWEERLRAVKELGFDYLEISIDEKDERAPREEGGHVWHVHQVFRDSDDDHDFGIWADVDLDATQEEGAVVFTHYRVGFVDD